MKDQIDQLFSGFDDLSKKFSALEKEFQEHMEALERVNALLECIRRIQKLEEKP